MDFLDKLDEGHNKAQLLQSLRRRKARLQSELQALTRQLHSLPASHDVEDGSSAQNHDSLVDILETYRLLGVSIQMTEQSVTLRFDTLYRNQYPATDYHCVQLVKKGENYDLGHHNLPPFIPIRQLEEKHLGSSIVQFVSEIRSYLYAYTQRREGLRTVQEEFSSRLAGGIDVNLSVTYMNLRLNIEERLPVMEVNLHYDMLRSLPQTVEVAFADVNPDVEDTPVKLKNKMDRLVAQWTASLTEHDIHTAFSKLLSKG